MSKRLEYFLVTLIFALIAIALLLALDLPW